MLLSIIIVSYNTAELTLQTLKSVEADLANSTRLKNKTELFVVDNNSKDTSVEAVRAFKRKATIPITLIANSDNAGFAAANNQGITQATGKYIFLLNSDTIVQPEALERLVAAFEVVPDQSTAVLSSTPHKLDHLGIVAATLLNDDGTVQPQGGSFPTLWSLFTHMSMLDDLPVLGKLLPSTQHTGMRQQHVAAPRLDDVQQDETTKSDLYKTDWVGGTALMIKRATINEIGLLDDHIFMYGEDVEWCMRAAAHHWDVAIHNSAYVTHLQNKSGSSENALKGEMLGYIYIWSKNKPLWQLPVAKAILLFGVFLRILLFSITNNQQKAATYLRILHAIQKSSV